MRPNAQPILATALLAALLSMAVPAGAAVDIADDPAQGESTAPLVLIEFADYQ